MVDRRISRRQSCLEIHFRTGEPARSVELSRRNSSAVSADGGERLGELGAVDSSAIGVFEADTKF